MYTYRLAQSEQDIIQCYPIMYQLRPHLTESEFVEQVLHQQGQGYAPLMAENAGDVQAVAGFVVGNKLAWGKHLYVDDLVTDQQTRSSGIGEGVINWLIDFARQHGCQEIHLDSGVQRFAAHKFYLRENFAIASHHFCKKL